MMLVISAWWQIWSCPQNSKYMNLTSMMEPHAPRLTSPCIAEIWQHSSRMRSSSSTIFKKKLTGSTTRWHTRLSWENIKTWNDLSRVFVEKYKHITDMILNRLVLQGLQQKYNESFCGYA
ncbi:hypothetical protein GQ457_04G021510 [Hibiscus cannabinus]